MEQVFLERQGPSRRFGFGRRPLDAACSYARTEGHLSERAQGMAETGTWQWRDGATTWSPEAHRILGPNLPASEVSRTQRTSQDCTAESRVQYRAATKAMWATGKPFNIDLEIIGAGSDRRWINVRGEPSPATPNSGAGSTRGSHGTVTDVTHRYQQLELLRASNEFSDALLDSFGDGVIACDAHGTITRVNHSAVSIFGPLLGRAEVGFWSHSKLLYGFNGTVPVTVEESPLHRAYHGERFTDVEFKVLTAIGEKRTVMISGQPLLNSDGSLRGALIVVRNTTARRNAELALTLAHDELTEAYDNAPVGYHSLDLQGTVVSINDTELELLGYLRSDLVAKIDFRDLVTKATLAAFDTNMMQELPRGGKSSVDVDLICKDGTILPTTITRKVTLDAQGNASGTRATVLDISDRRMSDANAAAHIAKIELLLMTDDMTGAATRRKLDETLRVEINRVRRYGGPLAVLLADIDHFKQINDTHGHHQGDIALKHFCEVVRSQIRGSDLLARLGGDEFIIVMPQVDAIKAGECAERIRTMIGTDTSDHSAMTITASFGVAELQQSESAESLIKRADQALYGSKNSGRNRVTFA